MANAFVSGLPTFGDDGIQTRRGDGSVTETSQPDGAQVTLK